MKVLFLPHSGSEQLKLEEFFAKVKEVGYDGVNMNIPFDSNFAQSLKELLH